MLTISPRRLELLQDWSSLEAGAWQEVLQASPTATIFQTFEYLSAWWSVWGRGKLLLVAVYDHDDRLAAIAPLFVDEGMIFFVGSGGSDYLDFIGAVTAPGVMTAVLDLARASTPDFVGLRFYHVPDDSPTGDCLCRSASELNLECFDEGTLEAPGLRFESWPTERPPPWDKKSLVRHERGLRKAGRLEVEHFTRYAQIEPLLHEFFEQHIARWAATPFPSLFLDEHQRRFYKQLSQALDAPGWLTFTRVSLDEQAIAFHFGFSFQRCFMWYKPSFDIRLAHHSPGEVLLRALILRARAEHLDLFDFGLGNEAFKQRFQTETKQARTWGLYPARHMDTRLGRGRN
jgi:CelD/BcsL family acetyltransferase involved in cellulose biosynthesis